MFQQTRERVLLIRKKPRGFTQVRRVLYAALVRIYGTKEGQAFRAVIGQSAMRVPACPGRFHVGGRAR